MASSACCQIFQFTRRALLHGCSAATALGLISACGRPRPARETPAGTVALRTDVTVTFMSTSGQVERGLIDQLIQRWEAMHPSGPKAQFLLATGNVVEKFLPMLTSGTPPELVSMSASEGVVFADQGHFAPP
jgi:ABC-type glycerol-3-phosphate transport system substrate-binding protein